MKEVSKKIKSILILSMVSIFPMGEGLLFSSSLAADRPAPANSVMFNYNDFIAEEGVRLTQENRMPSHSQKKAIEEFFQISDGKSRDILFDEIALLVKPDRKIVGEQAAALKRYINKRGVQVAAPKVVAPKGQNEADLLALAKVVAGRINVYFSQPYKTVPGGKENKTINCKNFQQKDIERPNHGLAHGMRQGIIALDIVEALNKNADNFKSSEPQALVKWVQGKIQTDPNFRKKILFAAAFQRTGRSSETESPDVFHAMDAANFYKEAQAHVGPGKLFNSSQEVEIFRDALKDDGNLKQNNDVKNLSQIFNGSHYLDLRRLTYGGRTSFQHEAMNELFTGGDFSELEPFVNNLWDRVGKYLAATGDRDGDERFPKKYNYSLFCKLSNNPNDMVEALFAVR